MSAFLSERYQKTGLFTEYGSMPLFKTQQHSVHRIREPYLINPMSAKRIPFTKMLLSLNEFLAFLQTGPKKTLSVKNTVSKRKPIAIKVKVPISNNKAKQDGGKTLTAQIIDAIQKHLTKKSSFTANDIYAIVSKNNDAVNKQSVITSVLKQMNSTFSHISVTERRGNGPRPVKLYNAK